MEKLINDPNRYDFGTVARVSTDGSPHGFLTLVVCLSATVVATILVSLIVFMLRKATRNELVMMQSIRSKIDIESQRVSKEPQPNNNTTRPISRIFTIFGTSRQSFDLN
ncbi:uncharacterized protein LOC129566285 [Sitodiplosis mosellana]|uniref:uncharacterized protein LOC129566285 n=1 Tax=Sitodiplosis mosellana TaxID=263140 RepID=UPI0024441FE1|nr:uncharacterized protein LOC129566285 [Sitodiplosis mosellana]